jgi:subtilisin-like proprotein convertase family protein
MTHPGGVSQVGIELVSPQGTLSVLKNVEDAYIFATSFVDQVLLSNAFYGENPAGAWTIRAVDGAGGGQGGTLVNWAIRIYGH